MSRIRLLLIALILVLFSVTLMADEPEWQLAPLSREFTLHQRKLPPVANPHAARVGALSMPSPSPMDLSHLRPLPSLQPLPRYFDWRDTDRLPGIRDQNGYPACQAFATMGMLEASLLPTENWDFSEWHIYRFHGFESKPYGDQFEGGNWQMNAAYLLRWSGPVLESDLPYGDQNFQGKEILPVMKHLQGMTFFPRRTDPLDNEMVKRFIMEKGPIYASLFYDTMSFNSRGAAHYYSGPFNANHGLVVVGWNDDFDRFRFLDVPPGNGAFILRNSWGHEWAEGGYFYVSYYDTSLCPRMGVTEFASPGNYSKVYQYDPLGVISLLGGVSTRAWGANVFTATEADPLGAVGFYLMDSDSLYTIRVMRHLNGPDPGSGELVLQQVGRHEDAGFVTVPLERDIPLETGERFSVAVHFQTPGTRYPIPVEYPVESYSSSATAEPGESFVSQDGSRWKDLTESVANANVCIKAYTRFSAHFQAEVHAEALMSEGWMLYYPYVRISINVDSGSLPVERCFLFRRNQNGLMSRQASLSGDEFQQGEYVWLDSGVLPGQSYTYHVKCFGPDARYLGESNLSYVEVAQ